MKSIRGIRLAAGFLVLLVLLSLFADFLSPNPPAMQNLDQFFHPPTRVHIFDRDGGIQKPFLHETKLRDPMDAAYAEDTEKAFPLQFFYKGYRYRLFGLLPWDRHLVGRNENPHFYAAGTDELGRDVWSRVLAGTRTSLMVVTLGIAIYSILGLTVGALAGIKGGWIDAILMRFSEFVLALPALYLVLALRALLPISIPFWQTLVLMVGTIAAIAWPPMARGVRGLVLQIRNSAHVEAAYALGGTPFHVFLRHILPFLRPYVLAQLAVAAPVFILGELVLSFLNVGFRDAGESWGSMLRSLKDIRVITDFYWNLVPLGMIFLTLLSLNVLSSRTGSVKPRDQGMRL